MNQKIELLSPIGSFESLHAAIHGGADAVYFGVEQLNMRAKSINSFSIDDLQDIRSICDKAHIKAYLTLNTVMYDHDIQLVKKILKQVKKNRIDAVIAADFAVLDLCREMDIPVHISTQANVSNIESVKFFSRYADVVVLARELTLKQVESICKEIHRKKIKGVSGELMRIEVFIHGALCMAVSGKCYLSLHEQNASANRGACTQNCRRPYEVRDKETGNVLEIDNEYIMSPKDLCTIEFLDELIKTGVSVLKIEGRGKGPEYAFKTASCYRQAIDAVTSGNFTSELGASLKEELQTVYNRGFWEGYFMGRKAGEWTKNPGSAATEKKVYIAKSTGYYPRIQVGEFLIEAMQLNQGEKILVTGKKFGVYTCTLDEFQVNGKPATTAVRGDLLTVKLPEPLSKNDKLYKILVNAEAASLS